MIVPVGMSKCGIGGGGGGGGWGRVHAVVEVHDSIVVSRFCGEPIWFRLSDIYHSAMGE